MKEVQLYLVNENRNTRAKADIIFVHGLNLDGDNEHYRKTWEAESEQDGFLPKWLENDVKGIYEGTRHHAVLCVVS